MFYGPLQGILTCAKLENHYSRVTRPLPGVRGMHTMESKSCLGRYTEDVGGIFQNGTGLP